MKLIFLIIPFSLLLNAQHPGDNIVRQGGNAFYNYEFERSIEILGKARKDYPDHPGVHIAWAAAHWRKDEAELSLEEIYTNFDNNLKDVESIYDSLLSIYPDNPEYMLYYGCALGLKARTLLGQKKWISTFFSAYRGFRIIQKAAQLDSSMLDAYLPIGIVEYYSGLSNTLVKTGAKYFGLNASREEGIRKMEIAASQSPWAWTESLSVLSYIYQFIDIDKVRGLEVSKKLVEEFPNNYDYKIHYAVSLLQTGDFKSSKLILDDLDKTLHKQRPRHQKGFGSYLNYLWGHYYYIMGNEEKSLEYLDKCINYYFAELDAFLGEAYFLKAKIMDKKGNRAEARKLYRKCIKLDNFSNVITLSKGYLKDPFEG